MFELKDLPLVNALLNSTSTILLLFGYYFIRTGNRSVHRMFMTSALVASGLFLLSYLVYHYNVGTVRFTGQGWVRTLYFSVLWSHTVLAVILPVIVITTLVRALRERFEKHRAIARWTLPVWLYVSITGVAIYVMLYRLPSQVQ
jgi:uncharacterized membrane protein YozB (DUF420 family)